MNIRHLPAVILVILLCLICLPSFSISAPKEQTKDASPPEVLVRIGEKTITKADFEARLAALPPEYQSRIKTDAQKKEFLEGFLQAQLLAMEAKAQKMNKKRAVARRIEDMTTSILAQEYAKEIVSKVAKPTDEAIKNYFEKNKPQYVNPPMVSAQHILIRLNANASPEEAKAALAKVNGIRKELEAGADFGKLAEKYSDDPGSKGKGGDVGFFTRERMVPEFSQAAFSLKKGEISGPVKTAFGYHLLKVNDMKEGKAMDLKEATPLIRSQLENQWRQEAMGKEIDRLKKKYDVTVNK